LVERHEDRKRGSRPPTGAKHDENR
jgi:hypothetical protein